MATRKRLTSESRKASIIDAAMRLFAERGFHGVSVDEIVKDVGVSPAVLYQHFGSKEALYEAVLLQSACQREDYLKAVPLATGSLEDVLRAMAKVFVGSMTRHPSILRMELHSLLDGSDANRQFFENRWKTFSDFIEFMIGELAEEHDLEAVNPRIAGLMFQGMIREALVTKCLEPVDRFPNMDVDLIVEELIALFMAAISHHKRTLPL